MQRAMQGIATHLLRMQQLARATCGAAATGVIGRDDAAAGHLAAKPLVKVVRAVEELRQLHNGKL